MSNYSLQNSIEDNTCSLFLYKLARLHLGKSYDLNKYVTLCDLRPVPFSILFVIFPTAILQERKYRLQNAMSCLGNQCNN
jgi:hypothetical protein